MRILVVEDDFVSRKFLQTLLSSYGDVDIAVNGLEAIEAFKMAVRENKPYNLICLDIMMPEKDGQETLAEIRNFEEEKEIYGSDGVKIIMTTALEDPDNILKAFRGQCEAYLVKPITKEKLVATINKLGF